MAHQSLFVVRWGHTAQVCQVSDFPKNCARSCEGSIHVRPDSTAQLTQSEVEHIRQSRPDLAKAMRVIKKVTPPPVEAAPPSKDGEAQPVASGSSAPKAKQSAKPAVEAKPDDKPAS